MGLVLGVMLLVVGIVLVADASDEGPSVGDLLALCDRGAVNGGKGVEAAGCEWFAAPCACKYRGTDGEGEPWCVPDDLSIDDQVQAVVAALRRLPDRSESAQTAVGVVLGRLYPCPPWAVTGSD